MEVVEMVMKYKELVRLFKNSYLGDKKKQIESEKTLRKYWKNEYGNDIIGISKFFDNVRNKVYHPNSDNVVLKSVLPVVGIINGEKRIIAVPKEEVRGNYHLPYNNQEDTLVSFSLDGIIFASEDCCIGSGKGVANVNSNYPIHITKENLSELLFEGYRVLDLESSLKDDKISDKHLFEHLDSKYGFAPNLI
jgi:hypothetical protein